MNGIKGLLLGIAGTFAFSWLGLIYVPNLQIGHLDPQMDEDGTDVYPAPQSGMAERGRRVFVANGCVYCHSQQVRADYAASDIDRKWGDRRSAPRDYIFDRPVLLGKMRLGPDLSNVGKRAPAEDADAPQPASDAAAKPPDAAAKPTDAAAKPAEAAAKPADTAAKPTDAAAKPTDTAAKPADAAAKPTDAAAKPMDAAGKPPVPATTAAAATPASANPATAAAVSTGTLTGTDGKLIPYTAPWHHRHLYSPRSLNLDSNMPSFAFLYEKRKVGGQLATDALKLSGDDAPPAGTEIVPTYDAKCLVAYLMSLDQSHPLKEVKSTTPPSPPAPGKGVK